MNTRKLPIRMYVIAFACLVLISPRAGAQVSQEKQHVLDWLSRPEVVERFGRISDAIWSYAELGLQEYKSSALLIETLEKAGVWYFLRNSDQRLKAMYERVLNCAKGAALATGTELAEVRVIAAIHQSHHNKALAELVDRNIKLIGMPEWTEQEHEFAKALQREMGRQESGMPTKTGNISKPQAVFTGGASSDHGDVTLIAPTATIRFPGNVPGATGHHWSTVAGGFGSSAWKGLNAGAKAMATSAIDLLTDPDALREIRKEFEQYAKEHPYESFLPADAEPPLDINEKLMKQYRPLMEPHYSKPK